MLNRCGGHCHTARESGGIGASPSARRPPLCPARGASILPTVGPPILDSRSAPLLPPQRQRGGTDARRSCVRQSAGGGSIRRSAAALCRWSAALRPSRYRRYLRPRQPKGAATGGCTASSTAGGGGGGRCVGFGGGGGGGMLTARARATSAAELAGNGANLLFCSSMSTALVSTMIRHESKKEWNSSHAIHNKVRIGELLVHDLIKRMAAQFVSWELGP